MRTVSPEVGESERSSVMVLGKMMLLNIYSHICEWTVAQRTFLVEKKMQGAAVAQIGAEYAHTWSFYPVGGYQFHT